MKKSIAKKVEVPVVSREKPLQIALNQYFLDIDDYHAAKGEMVEDINNFLAGEGDEFGVVEGEKLLEIVNIGLKALGRTELED